MTGIELHPFGCSMAVAFFAQIGMAIWALVVSSRIRPRSSRAAGSLAGAALIELVWRTIYCARQAGSARIYEANLEVVLDVIAVLDLLERGAVLVLAAMAVQALAKESMPTSDPVVST